MFGIGVTELLIILVIAIIAIGPDKLPDIAKALAKAFAEFNKAMNDIKNSVKDVELDKLTKIDLEASKETKPPKLSTPAPQGEKKPQTTQVTPTTKEKGSA